LATKVFKQTLEIAKAERSYKPIALMKIAVSIGESLNNEEGKELLYEIKEECKTINNNIIKNAVLAVAIDKSGDKGKAEKLLYEAINLVNNKNGQFAFLKTNPHKTKILSLIALASYNVGNKQKAEKLLHEALNLTRTTTRPISFQLTVSEILLAIVEINDNEVTNKLLRHAFYVANDMGFPRYKNLTLRDIAIAFAKTGQEKWAKLAALESEDYFNVSQEIYIISIIRNLRSLEIKKNSKFNVR